MTLLYSSEENCYFNARVTSIKNNLKNEAKVANTKTAVSLTAT